jgi:hypothetical protein
MLLARKSGSMDVLARLLLMAAEVRGSVEQDTLRQMSVF